jgi:hypothetical protein
MQTPTLPVVPPDGLHRLRGGSGPTHRRRNHQHPSILVAAAALALAVTFRALDRQSHRNNNDGHNNEDVVSTASVI